MDWFEWEPILKKEAVAEMEKAPEVSKAHGLDHLERVWSRCLKLGLKLNADLEILVAAAYLHDLGRHHNLEVHGGKSSELAEPILERINFPKEKTKKTLEAIILHDHNVPPERRKTIEAQILYDSDKLDAFGAIGAARWVAYYYLKGKSVEWIIKNLENRYEHLHLKESRDLARESYEYTINFFKKLREDLKPE